MSAVPEWRFALTDVEVYSALVSYIETERKTTLPISGEAMLHLIFHRNGDRFSIEIFSEPKSLPPEKFRWPWQKRPATAKASAQ